MKCTACNAEGAYIGLSTVECTNESCRHFVPSMKAVENTDNFYGLHLPTKPASTLWDYRPTTQDFLEAFAACIKRLNEEYWGDNEVGVTSVEIDGDSLKIHADVKLAPHISFTVPVDMDFAK